MTAQYKPVELQGGVPSLPYRLDPPLAAQELQGGAPVAAPSKKSPFASFVTWWTVLLAVLASTGLALALPGASQQSFNILFAGVGFGLAGLLALRPKLLLIALAWLLVIAVAYPNFGPLALLPTFVVMFATAEGFVRYSNLPKAAPVGGLSERGLATLEQSMVPTWGVAGGHVGANKDFGELAAVGAAGEKAFGEALKTLTDLYPFVRVFHGVCFTPGRKGADVDHVVLIGSKVFLLDSKNWAFGQYGWLSDGTVSRDGGSFSGGAVHMGAALEKWRRYLPSGTPVVARICVTKREGKYGRYWLDNARAPLGRDLTLNTIGSELEELMAEAARTEPLVDRRLVWLTAAQLQ